MISPLYIATIRPETRETVLWGQCSATLPWEALVGHRLQATLNHQGVSHASVPEVSEHGVTGFIVDSEDQALSATAACLVSTSAPGTIKIMKEATYERDG